MSRVSPNAIRVLIVAVLLAAHSTGYAGSASSNSLGFWNNKATGPLPNARRHSIPGGYIGCSILAYDSSASARIYCSAKTPSGFLACYSYNPTDTMLRAVASIGSASWLSFIKAEDSNQCTEIRVVNGSEYL